MKKASTFAVALFCMLILAACSSEPQKPASENKAAEPKAAFQPTYLTGREALQKMYIQARSWAADAKPYSLMSQATEGANGQDGKSGLWSAGFASPSRRGVKVYTWSGVQIDGAPEPGVGAKPEDTYNPSNTSTQIFDLGFLKVDSDKIAEEAKKNGGDKILKKTPDSNVFYNISFNPRENKLYWHVLYGPSRNEAKLRIAVDASTGSFIRVEK
ncbi:MAG TPA: hypothetical protein VN577_10390 [Terriglobales bacterium]|nr:hypothetical protein [Terriglobales bacterium]